MAFDAATSAETPFVLAVPSKGRLQEARPPFSPAPVSNSCRDAARATIAGR